MRLSELLRDLQNCKESSIDGDTNDIKVCLDDKEYSIQFVDFEEDRYTKHDKLKIRLFIGR